MIVRMPFGLKVYNFQFVTPLNNDEFLIFGGVKKNRKIAQVQIFNTNKNYSTTYHDILPQGISREKIWGPSLVQNGFGVLSNVQAEI